MVDTSAGKILSQARLAKRLTIDEVAHATKLRPDKIVALENDDFSRFGSIAYGKGFLQIYSRYLGVDISEQLRSLEIPANTVSVSDYQYLNTIQSEPEKSRSRSSSRSRSRTPEPREKSEGRRAPSILPLIFVLGIGAAAVYGFITINSQRIGSSGNPLASPTPAATGVSAGVSPGPGVAPVAPVAAGGPTTSGPANADAAFLANASTTARLQVGGPNPDGIGAKPRAADQPIPETEAAGPANDVVVEPIKKTWVKVHKNGPDSPLIFEDYLYPGAHPLKLRGPKFYVEVRDQDAVQIRKNGRPIAYQAPGISIQ